MNRFTGISLFKTVKNQPAEIRTICLYRYFSLILTSIFYLMKYTYVPLKNRVEVIICITSAAILLNYLYLKYNDVKNLVKIMVIIETAGNVAILIPTGGLQSPYIWYSLNTVLVTAYFLDMFYFYFNLLVYTTILAAAFYIFNSIHYNIKLFLLDNSNLLLSYLLIIFSIKLLVSLIKTLDKKSSDLALTNSELVKANKMIDESMEYIASLYQSFDNFINIKNKDKLAELIVSYTTQITKSNFAFLYISLEKNQYIFKASEEKGEVYKGNILNNIKLKLSEIMPCSEPSKYQIESKEFAVISIKSSYEAYGVLGIEIEDENSAIVKRENINQIKFLASLSSVMFERLKFEEINKQLLIAEEQNRIANEIHDSVLQRLFYVSCKVQTIAQDESKKDITEFNNELKFIKESIGSAMRDLREAIYSLSRKNDEMSTFEEKIRNYIKEVSTLNDVKISFELSGRLDPVNYEIKKAIYRILTEGIGNAIRHGKSKNLIIAINMERKFVKLKIDDDGVGFNLDNKLKSNDMGLGIKNMHNLVYSLNGNIDIRSRLNQGTSINIMLPASLQYKEKGEAL